MNATQTTEPTTATKIADGYMAAANGDLAKAGAALARSMNVRRAIARQWLTENATHFAGFRAFWAGSITASVRASLEAAS